MTDPEPRRSVRATKGQHKALEQLDQPIEAPKRRGGGKKNKKAAPEPEEPEEPEEEIIRCVCGATEQDEDSGEPWIACDQCGAWQHNICMGMSQYSEDLPKEYFCEICRPENHKELLSGIENGERPWEARRKAYEEEKAEKKKRGPKKGKKRASDLKEDASQKSKQSPPPPAEPKKEPKAAGQKRKNVDGATEKESKKIRKVSDVPGYSPPGDLPDKIVELPDGRQNPAKALSKSLVHAIGVAEKRGAVPSDGVSTADRAERLALQIERAVNDTHPNASSYAAQIRTLAFNLKGNPELCIRLLGRTLTPPMLATMSTEELASKELQKETAEMRARAEKQSIKITEDMPRIRRTHKGDEFIDDDGFAVTSEEVPSAPVRRPSAPKPEPKDTPEFPSAHRRSTSGGLGPDTQQSPSRADFDLNKVFSSVKSPTLPQGQAPSTLAAPPPRGPGIDPDVDRLLEDGAQSPPYSPKEDNDPDVVWRGNLLMNTIADVQVAAKHVGGVNLSETIGLPWDKLIPKTLTVCGRIEEQQAIVYVCSLRYSLPTDVVVVSLEPTSPAAKAGMQKLLDYFVSKKRYGVIGDKGVANVRDTYLVPLLPGGPADQPEFMLNLADNFLPETRTEPMMLAVFVYRNDPETVKRIHGTNDPSYITDSYLAAEAEARKQSIPGPTFSQPGSPALAQGGFPQSGRPSISAPAFSPTSPMGQFPTYPSPRNSTPTQGSFPPRAPTPQGQVGARAPQTDELQKKGEAIAREVLGHLITSPTVAFLLPQAHSMNRKEWEVIKKIYERDPKAREDLPYLSNVLEKESNQGQQQRQQQQQQQQLQQQHPPTGPSPPPQQQVHPQPPPQHRPPPQQQRQQPRHPQHPPPQPQPHPQQHQQHLPPQHQQQHPHQQPHHPPAPPPAPIRHTAIPPPPIPHPPAHPHPQPQHHQPPPHVAAGGPPRQTPIPPPPIPPQATAAAATTAGGTGAGGGAPTA